MLFSKETYDTLINSGWFEGRRIEINNIINLLENRGFEIFPPVRNFIQEFGMLELNVKSPHRKDVIEEYGFRKFDTHHTDVIKAIGVNGDRYCVTPFEEFAGESMVIVGKITNNNLWLMISESGKLYCDSGKLGNDAIEAFELLCTRKKNITPWFNL